MTRVKAATYAASLCFLGAQFACARIARAQAEVSEITITAGMSHSDRRDLSVSPLAFGGHGADLALGYTHRRGRTVATLSLDGGAWRLASSSSASTSMERLSELHVHAAALRAVGGEPANGDGFALGASLDATATLTAHAYGGGSLRVADFVLGLATIGPAASWRQRMHGGVAAVQVGAPIAGFVAHSYAPYRADNAPTRQRFVTPVVLRGLDGTVTYASSERERIGVFYVYRIGAMRYDDVQPIRSLTHALSVGVILRRGTRG